MLFRLFTVTLLAFTTGARMPAVPKGPAVSAAAADSDVVLTVAQLTHYLALKQALRTYWQDTTHDALRHTAGPGQQEIDLQFPQGALTLVEFDYPTLVAQNTELATLFTTNQLTPAAFAEIQRAVLRALGTLYIGAGWHIPLPPSSTPLGQNVALVKRHEDALAAVGVTAQYFTVRLTPDLLTQYVTVEKGLQAYWHADTQLRATAKGHILTPPFVACTATFGDVAYVYDYPMLVKQDTMLAAVFTRARFAPTMLAEVQVAAWQSLLDLAVNDLSPNDCPLPSGVIEQNVVAVRGARQELVAVGVVPTRSLEQGLGKGVAGTIDTKKGEDPIIFYKVMRPELEPEP